MPFDEIYSEGASGGSAPRPWLGVRGWGPSPPPTRGQSKASAASLLLTKGLHAITYMCTIAPLTTRILGKIPCWVKYQSALAAICGCILGAARDGARGLDFGRSPKFLFCPFLGFPRAPTILLWAYAHAMRRLLSSAPFCVHSPHHDTTRIFARAHQVRAPSK